MDIRVKKHACPLWNVPKFSTSRKEIEGETTKTWSYKTASIALRFLS